MSLVVTMMFHSTTCNRKTICLKYQPDDVCRWIADTREKDMPAERFLGKYPDSGDIFMCQLLQRPSQCQGYFSESADALGPKKPRQNSLRERHVWSPILC